MIYCLNEIGIYTFIAYTLEVTVAAKGHGKRGGARIIYYYFDKYLRFYLLTIYTKGDMTDLTENQKQQLKDFKNEQS